MSDNKTEHPFDRSFLKRLVAGMLRNRECASKIAAMIEPKWIEDDLLADIAEVAQEHIRKYKQLPTKLVIKEECGADVTRSAMFKGLYKVPTEDMAYCVDKLVAFCKTQAMKEAVLASVKDLEAGTPERMLTRVQDALKVGIDLTTLGTRFSDWKSRRDYYLEGDTLIGTLPTGFDHIDQLMQGGLGPGELGVFMAASGGGKSFALMNVGLYLAVLGKKVVHYTFELRDPKLLRRYDKRFVGRYANLVTSAPEQFLKHLGKQHRRMMTDGGDVIVHYAPTRCFTPTMMRVHLDSLATSLDYRPDVILVDYGDIMRPDRRVGEVRHEQAGIFEDLRAIAGEYSVPLWTATQANRAALEKKVIRKQDVSESFEKVMIADAIISICATPEEKEENRFRFFLAKMRDNADEKTVTGYLDYSVGLMRTDGIQTAVATDTKTKSKSAEDRDKKRLERMDRQLRGKGRDLERRAA